MKRALLITCAILTLATGALPQNITPQQVLQQIRQAYDKVQSLRATVQVKMGETFVASVQFLRPKQFSVQVTQNGKLVQSFTSDGATFTTYDAQSKTYTQQPVPEDKPLMGGYLNFAGFAAVAMEPQFGQMLEGFVKRSFNKAQSKGTQKVGATPCRVVELTGEGGTMTLFLGQKDGLVYRMVYKMSDGDTYEELVTALQLNTPVQKTAFAFKPPADAKKEEPKQQAERDDTTSLKGQEAPNFTLTDMEGNEVSLSSLRGKVVFLDFWATWCPPCRNSLPHTQALSQHEKAKSGDLMVLAVNAREELDKVKKFMQDNNYSFRVLMDKEGAVLNAYKVQGIPTFVLIDREGKIAWVQVGFGPGTEKQMEEAVQHALGQ
ncbi:Thiol-disulfide oxidoreductase ResA [bacterium HR16]|nr:Thiol-disulfide oxidoreductase ResA [bacterium HR16]